MHRRLIAVIVFLACGPGRVQVDETPIFAADLQTERLADMGVKKKADVCSCGVGESCCEQLSGSQEFPAMECVETKTSASCGTCEKTESCNRNFPDCCLIVDRLGGGPGCTNINGDPGNCGGCGLRCRKDEVCVSGNCEILP